VGGARYCRFHLIPAGEAVRAGRGSAWISEMAEVLQFPGNGQSVGVECARADENLFAQWRALRKFIAIGKFSQKNA
jgi:hypothetical protein